MGGKQNPTNTMSYGTHEEGPQALDSLSYNRKFH